jgi:predicted AAA+ superfamily ATPase
MNYYIRWLERRLLGFTSKDKVRIIFGARQTGKTVLLNRLLSGSDAVIFNLQDVRLRQRMERDPAILRRELQALGPDIQSVGIDEIQKVPALLDEIQFLYDQEPSRWQFFITGSSARKLRAHSANLLPGRCHLFHLFPVARCEEREYEGVMLPDQSLSKGEFPKVSLQEKLLRGDLPGVRCEADEAADATLDAYVENYLEEEIRREGLVKNMGRFHTFLRLAAGASGRHTNITKLSQESGVPASTIRSHYQLLVDTFTGHWVKSYRKSSRKRLVTTPRFLFFDMGVCNVASGMFIAGVKELSSEQGGRLLEHWIGLELYRRSKYLGRQYDVFFWRTSSGAEVDYVWQTPACDIPVEVKWTENPVPRDARHLETFLDLYPERASKGYLVCRTAQSQQLTDRVMAIPWERM